MTHFKGIFSTLLLIAFVTAVMALTGCGDDGSTSVTNPGTTTLKPTGTIQGLLVDKVTNEPVVGAVVSVGLSSATTNKDGLFVLKNVPCTEDALNGDVMNHYQISIRMSSVSSPVNMRDTQATYKYASYYYDTIEVEYTSLNDSDGSGESGGAGTNHDTPVTGLVSDIQLEVGKLAATIAGTVGSCSSTATEFTGVADATVMLCPHLDTENSSTGNTGKIIATTTTDANGAFSFANIESQASFDIIATKGGYEGQVIGVTTPADGGTVTLSLQDESNDNETVLSAHNLKLCPVDDVGPHIISVSPDPISDQAASTSQAVVFNFSEPILQTTYTDVTEGPVENLYDNIVVGYAGNKGGNVAYSVSWDADYDQLTVTFATSASGIYFVRLTDVGNLTDADGNSAVIGICDDDSEYSTAVNSVDSVSGSSDDPTVLFTTNGGATAGQVTDLSITTADIDYYTGTISLDWTATSGAKYYVVEAQMKQIWSDSSNVHSWVYVDEFDMSTASVTLSSVFDNVGMTPFVEEGEIKLGYNFRVTAFNSDDEASAASTSVSAADNVEPRLIDFDPITHAADDIIVIEFNEPMDEARAETLSNYILLLEAGETGTLEKAVYDENTYTVELTYEEDTLDEWDSTTDERFTILNLQDVGGNGLDSDYDQYTPGTGIH